jgi:abortive infection bacteriophage resistance protein
MATEIMSFGSLSMMFSGMLKSDQKRVAYRYGLQPSTLRSWMHHLVYVRNLCAHHARLWDRIWAIKAELPHGAMWHPPHLPGNDRLFSTLLILFWMMKHSGGINPFSRQWRERIIEHLLHPPNTPEAIRRMGLAVRWQTQPLWQ